MAVTREGEDRPSLYRQQGEADEGRREAAVQPITNMTSHDDITTVHNE